ncbi:MAG: DNA-formamidopyrimidine glycosylase family protein, partial [Candidatus Tectomicrobia bacterium]
MPELPEVETIRRGLAPQIVGRQITGVRVRQPQLRDLVDVKALQTQAVGCTIDAIDRRAKYILVRLHPDRVMVLHLGMTGRLWVGPPAAQDAPHDHLIFQLGS